MTNETNPSQSKPNGTLRVTNMHTGRVRNFPYPEWSYQWVTLPTRLRLMRDNFESGYTDTGVTFEFVEFSGPISIELILKD